MRGQQENPWLPKHVTDRHVEAVRRGLDYLKKSQASDGSWATTEDGSFYPVAMSALAGMAFLANGSTTGRGPHADQVKRTMRYLLKQVTKSGLICSKNEDGGRPMFGHGYALLFLSTLYGMERDNDVREEIARVVRRAVRLTARGQSRAGGWLYYPHNGDEGAVTITQMQGLRAAHNAGFLVPKKTVNAAIKYLEKCENKDGGISYSLMTRGSSQPAISAAAIATLYNAGEYDSPLAKRCLNYVYKRFKKGRSFGAPVSGHAYYGNLYAAQGFYVAGDKFWDEYFPRYSGYLLKQQKKDGSWKGDSIGTVFGTACACIILQLPYKLLPIYQR